MSPLKELRSALAAATPNDWSYQLDMARTAIDRIEATPVTILDVRNLGENYEVVLQSTEAPDIAKRYALVLLDD